MPVVDADALERTRQERYDRANQLILMGSVAAFVFPAVLAWMIHTTVPHSRLLAWCAVMGVIAGGLTALSATYLHRRRSGLSVAGLEIAEGVLMVGIGAGWGAAPLALAPPVGHLDTFLVILMFAIAAASINVVLNGPVREFSDAYCFTLSSFVVVGIIIHGGRLTVPLTVAAIGYFALMIGLHRLTFHSIVAAMNLRAVHEVMNDELIAANALLEAQATTDPLTGLANRTSLVDGLRDALEADGHVALIFCDLDRFKVINDSMGHGAGDQLLTATASRLESLVEAPDVATRLGGDEFCLMVTSTTTTAALRVLAERVIAAVSAPVDIGGRDVRVTTSVGIATARPGDTAPDVLRHADAALYQAKEAGRNRQVTFDDRMRSSLARRMTREQELRRAIHEGEIVPWFQPEVALRTGLIVGAEVLARWHRGDGSIVAAWEFVPLAEECGLIEALNDTVFRAALEQRGLWRSAQVPESLRIRLNLSARELSREGLAGRLLRLFSDAGCVAANVALEVTESSIITDVELAATQLGAIRDAGISISLDDFGTGYSSLALLRALPLDGVKIDKSFITNIVEDRRDQAMVRAVVGLAAEMGLVVTAEGVEHRGQAEILTSMGCDTAQGHLWSPAVTARAFLGQLFEPALDSGCDSSEPFEGFTDDRVERGMVGAVGVAIAGHDQHPRAAH